MRMTIAWSDNAIALLDKIYEFYATKSKNSAYKLYNRLLNSAEPLRTFPQAGIAEKHYKLICTITDDLIEIHAIWDCRQEDRKLKDMFQ